KNHSSEQNIRCEVADGKQGATSQMNGPVAPANGTLQRKAAADIDRHKKKSRQNVPVRQGCAPGARPRHRFLLCQAQEVELSRTRESQQGPETEDSGSPSPPLCVQGIHRSKAR